MSGALEGHLVIDLTHAVSGPYATMHLADHGARVIKVEKPGRGDSVRYMPPVTERRSAYFAALNRGKEGATLDFAVDADRALLLAMVDAADVVVENFRPGVLDRQGLGPDVLCARNPRLVYARLSGYGQTGPYADRPAFDLAVQASSGHMAVTGEPDGRPMKMGTIIADFASGLALYAAITTALLGRARTGLGTVVDVSMQEVMLSMLEPGAVLAGLSGDAPPRVGNGHPQLAPFDTFPTADRDMVVCVVGERPWRAFCGVVGRPDLPEDPRFATNLTRLTHTRALREQVQAALAAFGADHWTALLNAAGVPAGPVASVAEAVSSAHVAARKSLTAVEGPLGPTAAVENPLRLSGFPPPQRRRDAPTPDSDRERLVAEFLPSAREGVA